MADSFALTDGGVVLQQPAPTIAGPQITLQGGTNRAVSAATPGLAPGGEFQKAADMSMKAIDALGKLAGNALAPYIEEQQQRAYYDGMSQVVQGRALQDIHREQPWYTKIFGPSATVQGAQKMTVITALSQAQSEAMAAMPELRKQSPEMMRKYLVEQAMRIGSTGDPQVDGIVQQKLAEGWGAALSNHMQQHYAWVQEDMGNKFVTMQIANGELLQTTLGNQANFADPQQMQFEVEKFNAGLTRPAGMSDESYGKYMHLSAQSQLANGNFAAYEAMKANPEVWNAIPPDARQKLENSEEMWAARALRDAPALTGIMDDYSRFEHAVKQGAFLGDENALLAAIDKHNADFKAQTGAATNMIDNAERGRLIQQFRQARAASASAYARIAQGLADAQAQRTAVVGALNAGDPSRLPPNTSEVHARDAMEETWAAALNGEIDRDNIIDKLALVSWEKKLRVPLLEAQLKTDADAIFTSGGDLTKRQIDSLEIMQKMLASPRGLSALADYTSAADAAKVLAFLKTGVDPADPKATLAVREMIHQGWGAHTSKEDKDAAHKYVKGQDPGWWARNIIPNFIGGSDPGALTGLELNDATKAWMADGLAPYVAMVMKSTPGVDAEQAAQIAFSKIYGNPGNVDFVDGTIVPRNPFLPNAQSLYSGVQQLAGFPISQFSKDYQDAVRDTLRDRVWTLVEQRVQAYNASGKSPHLADETRFLVHKYQAVSGTQMQGGNLAVHYRHKDTGQEMPIIISPAQVLDRYKQNMNKPPVSDAEQEHKHTEWRHEYVREAARYPAPTGD